MTLILAACSGGPAPAAEGQAPEVTPIPAASLTPSAQATEALAAIVNGEPITLAEFQNQLQREGERLAAVGVVPADRSAFEQTVLNNLIDQVLIEQAAAVQGIQVTDADVDEEIALNIEMAGGEDAFEAWLAANAFTRDGYRESVRSALLTARIRDQVITTVPQTVEQAHARHILVSTEAEAQQLYEQLMNGADFAQLAMQNSRDVSTRELGGDLGWFTREQLTEPVVANVAFTQEIGVLSQPVASRLGYHLIQTLERSSDRPLDEATRAGLYEMAFERWRQSLWDQAEVQRFIGG